ncbi:hypothetical protein [Paraglaciecola sp.]|uniref:hypothetical protein n=1 Tax=Paraglaciecola sp. TaxID=1920173 RepID=UPI003EF417C4
MKQPLTTLGKLLGLSFWHAFSFILAAMVIQLLIPPPLGAEENASMAIVMAVSLIETLVLFWLATMFNISFIKKSLILIVIFHGTKSFMMLIEALFFLNIWTDVPLMSLSDILFVEIHNLLMACLYCPLVAKLANSTTTLNLNKIRAIPLGCLIKNLGLVSVLYAVCYLTAGAFILIPLAGESFAGTYSGLSLPWWMPIFQIGRGLLWGLIILPIIVYFTGSLNHQKLICGIALATLGSAQLLFPNPQMAETLRYAHLIEIAISMFIFGWISVWIFTRKQLAEKELLPAN